MPIYVESRDLDVLVVGFIAEHQYLVYIPDGQELNYDAWRYIGRFPTVADGSLLTSAGFTNILLKDAEADRWKITDFPFEEVATVATILNRPFPDITVSDMVAEGVHGKCGISPPARNCEHSK